MLRCKHPEYHSMTSRLWRRYTREPGMLEEDMNQAYGSDGLESIRDFMYPRLSDDISMRDFGGFAVHLSFARRLADFRFD